MSKLLPRLRSATVIVAVTIITITVAGCTIQTKTTPSDSTRLQGITVQGTGVAFVVPDVVKINLLVTVLADSSEAALDQVATVAKAVRGTLSDKGVDEKDITSQSVSVAPEYEYLQSGQKLIGYRASQYFEVIVKKADSAGDILDAVVAAGGNDLQVTGATPVVMDSSKGATMARKQAVESARAKAESYAKLVGVELGDVEYLTELNAPIAIPMARAEATVSSDAKTEIDLGQQQITVTVEIRWELDR